jgi:hypothetical protein
MLPREATRAWTLHPVVFTDVLINSELVVGTSLDDLLWVQTAGIGSSISPGAGCHPRGSLANSCVRQGSAKRPAASGEVSTRVLVGNYENTAKDQGGVQLGSACCRADLVDGVSMFSMGPWSRSNAVHGAGAINHCRRAWRTTCKM